MPALRWLYRHVFNSVPFGISLLVMIGLYIAIGSGVTGLREWLEMDDLLFFNWWPFKLLIVMLVINLMTVTVSRIPLTLPRYGVWSIHLGIVLLLVSLGSYYRLKVEGMVPLIKGQTATSFYDRWERALYIRTPFSADSVGLEGLPRFKAYDDRFGNADYLDKPTLRGLEPQVRVLDEKTKQTQLATLAEAIGAKQPVTLDIVGYYPYGQTEGWILDLATNNTGLKLTSPEGAATWIVGSEAASAGILVSEHAFVEHRHMPGKADVEIAANAAKLTHKLSVRVGDVVQDLKVEPGHSLDIPNTGYTLLIEEFRPQFPLSSGDGSADGLTIMVTRKNADGTTTQFRRMVLSGREAKGDSQTDFELGVEGAGPFGKRLREGLLDSNLQLGYTYSDPTKLLPSMSEITAKYILFTSGDAPGITMLRVSTREPSVVAKSEEDRVDLHVNAPTGMFDSHGSHAEVSINVQRFDHVKKSDAVVVVPPEDRQREVAEGGGAQMVRVKVTSGDWSQIVPVSFDQFAMMNPFRGQSIQVPGAEHPFQLMLGMLRRPLPVAVRLDGFEATPYAGGEVSGGSIMRDFKSNITFFDHQSKGVATRASASLNEPAFFKRSTGFFAPSESWIFSQARWDPSNTDFTALQVGNRPFVTNMTVACGLIFGGLLYAFYLRPIIIKRMKANALRAAAEGKKPQRDKSRDAQELLPTV
jgi:hypothetical protein